MVGSYITESGMSFITAPKNKFFHIEKSLTYSNLGTGVKIAEFLYLRDSNKRIVINIIEAKSSSPQPGNKIDFDHYISDITEKFTNTLSLYLASILGRHIQSAKELPKLLQNVDSSNIDFRNEKLRKQTILHEGKR